MKHTGVELIAQERKEQIEKHGFDVNNDKDYSNGELIQAAKYCIDSVDTEWPGSWEVHFAIKIADKDRVGQLKVAGAFIAAEIDRIQNMED